MISKLAKAASNPDKILPYLRRKAVDYIIKLNNYLVDLKPSKKPNSTGLEELDEIKTRSLTRTDVSDHLVTLFIESSIAKPDLIVELGVRGGESTFVFERVAKLFNAKLVCVDIEDCSNICTYKNAFIINSDDVVFAARFGEWCREKNINPKIDVLHIDTSHLYDHTKKEIDLWFPLLSETARVFLHDTNLKKIFRRKDGSMGNGWDNERGVIRALEEHFNATFNEARDFIDFRNGWLIKHYASCNGLTVLHKASTNNPGTLDS